MSHLFKIDDKVVFPNAETLLIEPFKSIWKRDKTKGKEEAVEDFAYIEFMTSMLKSNPYRQYPEEDKHNVIKKAVITRKGWRVDKLIKEAMEQIKIFQEDGSTTYGYYLAAKMAAEKMKDFFMEVDINERNFKSGTPVYKPTDITRALNDTDKVLSNLKALEIKVEEELFEQVKNKANRIVSPFADPDSI